MKSAAETLLKAARGMNINVPVDNSEAMQAVGRMIMEQKTLGATTADAVLNALVDKLGVKKSAEEEVSGLASYSYALLLLLLTREPTLSFVRQAGVEERAANACASAGNASIFLFLKEVRECEERKTKAAREEGSDETLRISQQLDLLTLAAKTVLPYENPPLRLALLVAARGPVLQGGQRQRRRELPQGHRGG